MLDSGLFEVVPLVVETEVVVVCVVVDKAAVVLAVMVVHLRDRAYIKYRLCF